MKMNKRMFMMAIALGMVFSTSMCFAEGGTVFTAVGTAISEIQGAILKWSTGMAVIGVGWGAFIKKLAGGDPQKIEKGNKAIISSIAGWTLVNGLTLILNTVQNWL